MKIPRPTAIAPRGITLIESLAVLCIVAIILGSALPSFARMAEKRQLEGTVAQLATDIQHVRSLAVAENNGHRLAFGHGPAGSCYVVHTGPAQGCRCEATGAVQCVGEASARRSVFFPADGPVQVRANVGSILFHPVHGTSTPTGTLRVVARSGASVHQIVNLMGRTRACSPNGVSGYPAC
jgi:type IV fimbrial biogenesis protein FimT